ncbi:serine hydrolase domain-containing protein [Sphingopyxis macrogoltabida]|nr:serine hydrolase domain-containing protein [Sphingopyxis macrogoltabida]
MRSFFVGLSLSAALLAVSPAAAEQPSPAPASIAVGSDASMVPPEGWSVAREGNMVRFVPPEANLVITLVPVAGAKSGADAAAAAWTMAKPGFSRPVHLSQTLPARDGWDEVVVVSYDVPPAENAVAQAVASRKGTAWTVVTIDGALATLAKRGAQINTAADTLRPANYTKESFAGRQPHALDTARIAELETFIRTSMDELKIPGAGIALIDDGKIVYERGIGVKDIETGAPVDKDTLFMIASNTKGMATLLLSTLVDQGKLDWDKPVIDYMPSFRLGDAETTRKVLVKHLVCACTGLPRKDMLWLFNTRPETGADDTFRQLAETQPTSGFGEVFQYNNLMASAAGYLGAHILYPDLEIGAAFDRAIQERIFDPLGMRDSTMSNPKAIAGNWAKPYDTDLDDKIALVDMKFNDTVVPYRPAGGAWSSAHDMALYVLNELKQGELPGGKRMVSARNLLARRVHYVPTGENQWYGMGLEDDASSGVSVISHGGSLFGYKSNWFALPASGIGVVVLTNSENGYTLANQVKRRLLELVFDGKPEAKENVASAVKRNAESFAKFRSELTLPVGAEASKAWVGEYSNPELGPLSVQYRNGTLSVRATSIWSDVATKTNKDGTISLVTISPGIGGVDLLAATRDGKRALILNDGQHEYVFIEARDGGVAAAR